MASASGDLKMDKSAVGESALALNRHGRFRPRPPESQDRSPLLHPPAPRTDAHILAFQLPSGISAHRNALQLRLHFHTGVIQSEWSMFSGSGPRRFMVSCRSSAKCSLGGGREIALLNIKWVCAPCMTSTSTQKDRMDEENPQPVRNPPLSR